MKNENEKKNYRELQKIKTNEKKVWGPFSGFIPDSGRRPERADKYVTFNEYVRVLAQLFQLTVVETHFYSWSQFSIVMTLHIYVSFVRP